MIVQRRLVLLIQQGTNIDNIDCRGTHNRLSGLLRGIYLPGTGTRLLERTVSHT